MRQIGNVTDIISAMPEANTPHANNKNRTHRGTGGSGGDNRNQRSKSRMMKRKRRRRRRKRRRRKGQDKTFSSLGKKREVEKGKKGRGKRYREREREERWRRWWCAEQATSSSCEGKGGKSMQRSSESASAVRARTVRHCSAAHSLTDPILGAVVGRGSSILRFFHSLPLLSRPSGSGSSEMFFWANFVSSSLLKKFKIK